MTKGLEVLPAGLSAASVLSRTTVLVCVVVTSYAPQGDACPASPAHHAFEDHFALLRSLVLEERGDSVLSSVGFLRERPA